MYDEDDDDDEVVQWRELQYTDCLPSDNVVSRVAQIKDVLAVFVLVASHVKLMCVLFTH